MFNIIIYFISGGVVTTAIVLLEQSGFRLLSGLATLMPVFTLVGYLFIGDSQGGAELSKHGALVLVGTFVSWVPYMLTVIVLAPYLGSTRSIAAGLVVFFLCAIPFLLLTQRFSWFQ